MINSKTTQETSALLQELMLPDKANGNGLIHGGELFKMMDNTAWIVAYKHAGGRRVLTAKADKVAYICPVKVGNIITCIGRMTFVGKSSMEVQVKIYVDTLEGEERKLAVSGYFTMVALDENNKPVPVLALELVDDEDHRLFTEGEMRYLESKKENKKIGS